MTDHRSGFVALVGRPNTGKSSILNRLIGQKLSIVTRKAQTTRHRILGVLNRDDAQVVIVDTPGMHRGESRRLNKTMNRAAADAAADADVIVFVCEALRWTGEDTAALAKAMNAGPPVIAVVNKTDLAKPKQKLLPFLQELSARADFAELIPVSAQRGDNLDALMDAVVAMLPEGPPLYPEDQLSDRSEDFRTAELVREKLTTLLHEELPYGLSVEVERREQVEDRTVLHVVIYVERASHKAMVIGRGGSVLKEVGSRARRELSAMLDTRVHLELWVKVREGWPDDQRALKELGYDEG